MKSWTIVGYVYQADIYCDACIVDAVTADGGAYDGWALAPSISMPTEHNLSEIAFAFGIDRTDERSFDSGNFPKVILAGMVESDDERCGACHESLLDI